MRPAWNTRPDCRAGIERRAPRWARSEMLAPSGGVEPGKNLQHRGPLPQPDGPTIEITSPSLTSMGDVGDGQELPGLARDKTLLDASQAD